VFAVGFVFRIYQKNFVRENYSFPLFILPLLHFKANSYVSDSIPSGPERNELAHHIFTTIHCHGLKCTSTMHNLLYLSFE
jgi:hypothetical protein